jgi:hypothetical protein
MRLKEFATPKSALKPAPKDANAAEQQREKARKLKIPTNTPRTNPVQRAK